MAGIVLGPNRAYPALPTVGDTVEAHTLALQAIVECIQTHERRSKNVLDSFVRVGEMVDLGLVDMGGTNQSSTIVLDGPVEEATTHHHDGTYLRLDGNNDPVTGHVVFEEGLDSGDDITLTAGAINWHNESSVAIELLILDTGAPAGEIEVGHYSNEVNSVQTVADSGAFTTLHTLIASGTLTEGDDYLVVAKSYFGAESGASADEPTDNIVRLSYGGSIASVATSFREIVTGGSPSQGDELSITKIITATAGDDLILEAQTADSPDNDVTAEYSHVWALNLTDLGTDNYIAEAAIGSGSLINDTEDVYTNLGSPYTIGDGVSDYVLFVNFTVTMSDVGVGNAPDFEAYLAVDGGPWSTAELWRIGGGVERQNDGESYSKTGILLLPAAASADLQFKAKWSSDGGFSSTHGDVEVAATVTVLRLNGFTDYTIESSADLSDPGGSGEVEALNGSFTSSATNGDWGFLGGLSSYYPNSGHDAQSEMRVDINAGGDTDCADTQAVTQDVLQAVRNLHAIIPIGTETNIDNGDSVEFGLFVLPAPSTGNDEWDAAGMVAFSYYATTEATVFIVGDPSYATLIDGLSVVIDSTLNVTGAVDLDSTLNVDGAATLGSTLDVTGAVDFDSTLNVDGVADFNADVEINDATLWIYGATPTNAVSFDHDDTDLNIVGANTTDINITGITSIQAGTVDADFDSLSITNIQFDLSVASPTPSEGLLTWNADEGTLEFGLPGGVVNLQIGQEHVIRARNTSGSTILDGSVVYVTGASGNKPLIALADADSLTMARVVAVATEDIGHNSNGYVTTAGLVRGLDTSSFSPGDDLWLSQTAGEFTGTKPPAPAASVFIGHVILDHGSNGIVLVDITPDSRVRIDDFELDLQAMTEVNISMTLDDTDVSVSSNGTTITFDLEQTGGGDVRVYFSDGVHTHDCTPAATVALTAGTDTSPTTNYVYILQSTKALTVSTSGWPSAEHAPLATVICQSAASAQTDGVYKMHAWTDHNWDDVTGHLGHLNLWIRSQPASWISGTLCTPTVGAATFDLAVSAGSVLQLHSHAYPAFDTSTGSEIMIVNQNATPYDRVGNMVSQLTDAAGGSMSGKYYNLVVWGVVSEDSGDCQFMINLPTGSYNSSAAAVLDADATTVYDVPTDFIGTGFLIARLVVRHQVGGNTYSIVSNVDLRGTKPSTSAGGTVGGGVTAMGDLSDADTTGALDNDLLTLVSGVWTPTIGALTWDGSALKITGYLQPPTATSAALDDIADAINTAAGKIQSAMVYNTTTDNPVYAVGNADGDVWVDGAGTTVHTPV